MHPERNDDGIWRLVANSTAESAMPEKSQSPYFEALTRHLTSFDLAFASAKQTSEHAFEQTLIGVRDLQDSGWDPFESSIQFIREVRSVHKQTTSFTAARQIELWNPLSLQSRPGDRVGTRNGSQFSQRPDKAGPMDNEILKLIIRRVPFGFGFPRLTKEETEEYIDELERRGVPAMPDYSNEQGKLYLAKVSIPHRSHEIIAKLMEILNS